MNLENKYGFPFENHILPLYIIVSHITKSTPQSTLIRFRIELQYFGKSLVGQICSVFLFPVLKYSTEYPEDDGRGKFNKGQGNSS